MSAPYGCVWPPPESIRSTGVGWPAAMSGRFGAWIGDIDTFRREEQWLRWNRFWVLSVFDRVIGALLLRRRNGVPGA
jgi:hypothetical protein